MRKLPRSNPTKQWPRLSERLVEHAGRRGAHRLVRAEVRRKFACRVARAVHDGDGNIQIFPDPSQGLRIRALAPYAHHVPGEARDDAAGAGLAPVAPDRVVAQHRRNMRQDVVLMAFVVRKFQVRFVTVRVAQHESQHVEYTDACSLLREVDGALDFPSDVLHFAALEIFHDGLEHIGEICGVARDANEMPVRLEFRLGLLPEPADQVRLARTRVTDCDAKKPFLAGMQKIFQQGVLAVRRAKRRTDSGVESLDQTGEMGGLEDRWPDAQRHGVRHVETRIRIPANHMGKLGGRGHLRRAR